MSFRIETIDEKATEYVARHMRQKDHDEVFACRWNDEVDRLVEDSCWFKELAWNAFYKDEPVAALGLSPVRPGVYTCWLYATDKFDKISISLTKFAKSVMIPAMIERHAHRVYCYSMEGHDQAQRWLDHLGVKREHEAKGYGRAGETFFCHVWRPQHVQS